MKIFIFLLIVLLPYLCTSQDSGFKLFLIGDTGEDTLVEPALRNFLDIISKYPNSAAVFLGDNCYHDGLLGRLKGYDGSSLTIKRLAVQFRGLLKSKYMGSVYFIPGNHDWWNASSINKGKHHLSMEETFIESNLAGIPFLKNKTSTFMPENGDPIAAVDLDSNRIKLIFLDTQWLIIQKNDDEKDTVYEQLENIIKNANSAKQNIVVVGHHPIYTIGKHSKKTCFLIPFKQARDQNIFYHSYKEMREKIENILSNQNGNPIIYASGHDHVLQHFQIAPVRYIVSGAGSKSSCYNKKNACNPKLTEGIPADRKYVSKEGFFEVDYTGDNPKIKMYYLDNNNSLIPELIK